MCFEDGVYDQNDNSDIEVKLLCGADVLESFAVPELWKQEHVRIHLEFLRCRINKYLN